MAKPRIFVQMVSYRDPECHWTLKDLFEKASRPERIFVGLCWQFDPEADQECFAVEYPRAKQVRRVDFHVKDAKGAGWARNQAQALYKGEEYILQIQAHMRFEPGWDDTLIELLENLPTQKAILTAWLPGYAPPDTKTYPADEFPLSTVNRLGAPGDAQLVHLIRRMLPVRRLEKPVLTCAWVGNFMFARASVLKEVPFDPHIYFWGEELNFSARLWTHGYDIYHLDRVVLYHYWDRKEAKGASEYRDHAERRNRLSLMRNLHLFGLQETQDKEALIDIDVYRLGNVRTLAAYWKFAGIDLVGRTIAPHAREGKWDMPADMPRIFVAIASHRDPEISPTLADMFAKATWPDRIRVGICLQIDPREDAACRVKSDRMGQIQIIELHHSESKGANWARGQALSLQEDEAYTLQIDSHMRFEPGWDERLIDMLERCPAQKPVISAYLPDYDPPDKRQDTGGQLLRMRVRRAGGENDAQLIHLSGLFVDPASDRGGLYPTPFCIANCLFSHSTTFREVPPDPHYSFYGDEISYSARLWTHGYDIFQADGVIMYHHWSRAETLHLQHYRQKEHPGNRRSLLRVRHLLGIAQAGDESALTDIERYGLGSERPLAALWEFAGVDVKKRSVTPAAEKGIWTMAAHKKASKTGKKTARKSGKPALPRIFVQIASYRDPDCQHTVKDLFDKAAHPERIFVGICWQFVKDADDICFKVPYPYPKQVRVHSVNAKDSKGVCWARGLTQKLWEGEEFTLQIDSHMRFEPGWDDTLIDMWNECGKEKAVLTCYPPGFTPPDKLERKWIFGMAAKHFDQHGILLMHGRPAFVVGENEPARPLQGAFSSACMYFAPSSIIKDVPYDPYLYFFGEEISLAVRFWTHGYDLFHPNKLCIYHDWDRSKRPTHFSDHRDWGKLNDRAFARVRHMLGVERSKDKEITKELETYGLGKKRSLAEYEAWSGVTFATKSISQKALDGKYGTFEPTLPRLVHTRVDDEERKEARIFVQIASYRDPECQHTVKDLFDKAANPDRVHVGICWQFDPEEDKHCFEVSTRPEQVRMLPVNWREAEGVCWARSQGEQLWDGEEYYLQIDSHMRFVPGWDELMIEELAACDSKKPVISCSPASYTPPNDLEKNPRPTIRRVQPFFADGNLRGKGESLDREPPTPLNGAFIAGGYVFARSDILKEVPYDPYLYFDQEEVSYALRLYTHGWDVFSARRQFLYHYYNTKESVRPLHWRDTHKEDSKRIAFLRERGMKRFDHMTGYKMSTDPEVLKEIGQYWLGTERTLEQFEEYTGINFKKKTTSEKALRCGFIKDLAKYRTRPIIVPEIDGEQKQVAGGGRVAVATTTIATTAKLQPVQTASVISAPKMPATLAPLDFGDYVPMFYVTDTDHKPRAIELYGGRYTMLFFLPSGDIEYLKTFFKRLAQEITTHGKREVWQLFVLDDTVENLAELRGKIGTNHVLWADPGRKISRAFGITRTGDLQVPPTGYMLNNNLKVVRRYDGLPAASMAETLVRDTWAATDAYAQKNAAPRIFSETAPALIVPDALPPELCQKLIHSFRTGHTFEGTVGAEEKKGYRPNAKIRTDHILSGKLLDEVDEKLSRSFFPEIKKIFGFEVTHRELYKVGLYTGEKKGFFKQHRDNYDLPLGYRRVATTVHLNEDYEGGGLNFPEYGRDIYRPKAGAGIAFSCSTLHEALPVTKGERFVLVGFFHGNEDEAFRRYYLMGKDSPLKEKDFIPTLRQYPELELSRGAVDNWRKEQVSYSRQPGQVSNAPLTSIVQPKIMVNTIGNHQPKKVYESKAAIVFDDFLPEAIYEKTYNYAIKADYERINTGKVTRAWHVQDQFPLRSTPTLFYYAEGSKKPEGNYVYPTKTDADSFIEHVLAMQPHAQHLTGKQGEWGHFSATAWLYPMGTGLSMHDDGSGIYTGAYTYFLGKTWRPHWGGLLLLVEEEGNQPVQQYRATIDQMEFYKRQWMHENRLDEMLMEHGFARCIMPKRNRMVFIANNAYHMVTRVNEAAGDNHRMSIAGFFDRKKS